MNKITLIEKEKMIEKLLLKCEADPNFHLRATIMVRWKDNPELKVEAKIFKRYAFSSFEDFLKYKDEIIDYVIKNNARFYLNPNIKSYEVIGYEVAEKIITNLKIKNFKHISELYDSTANKNPGLKNGQKWILDIDIGPETIDGYQKEVVEYLDKILKPGEDILSNSTKDGLHFLIPPHQSNTQILEAIVTKYNLKEICIKPNSPTLIYWKELFENGK